ncbi:MAG: hypothetical protein KGM92_09960 [Acidobacteriota bacterium]|nr:hypothetical protein [Acidobacteriota bacterium]
MREAFPEAGPYRYVILDRDSIFDADVIAFVKVTGLKPKRTSVQPPWQNGTAERLIGSCREILDQVIALNEEHLRRLIRDSIRYHERIGFTIPWTRTPRIGGPWSQNRPPTRPRFRCRAWAAPPSLRLATSGVAVLGNQSLPCSPPTGALGVAVHR